MAVQSVATHDRVRDERMAGVDAGEQDSGGQAETQQPDAGSDAEGKGNGEGEQAEAQAVAPVTVHASHLKLKAGQEHDVVDAHLTEELEGAVVSKEIEAILPHEDASHDESDDGRHSHLPEKQRREQDDAEHHREDPRGVGDESRCGQRHCQGGMEHDKLLRFGSKSAQRYTFFNIFLPLVPHYYRKCVILQTKTL